MKLILALLVVAMTVSNTTYRKRAYARELHAAAFAPENEIDLGVVLTVVAADPNGKILIPGKPPLRVVDERTFGGILDLRPLREKKPEPPAWVGRTREPLRWFCSEQQFPVILHADDDPQGDLVYGSMRGGKTSCIPPWVYLRWIENIHHDLGTKRPEGMVTAPTNTPRLLKLRKELMAAFRPGWFRFRRALNLFEMVDGTQIQLISTHQQSEEEGSRFQGLGLWWCASDEIQDSLRAIDEIATRLSEAPDGRYKWLATATAKDSPAWREWRDQTERAKVDGKPLWKRRTLLGKDSPFVPAQYWQQLRASLSDREAKRRLDAVDLPPERATYPTWSHEHNLIDVPEVGWRDVTTEVLRASGDNLALLVGNDPGTLCDVSEVLKAFERPLLKSEIEMRRNLGIPRHDWVVVDEVTTEESETEEHVESLLELVRGRYRCNLIPARGAQPLGPQILVRCDPSADRSVYTVFRGRRIRIKPAEYSDDQKTHGRIPLKASIEVICRLLHQRSLGIRRLFVARDERGRPRAPKLVHALETAEKDLAGKPDAQRKGKRDVSHWPAALRYALWKLERPRLVDIDEAAEADRRGVSGIELEEV